MIYTLSAISLGLILCNVAWYSVEQLATRNVYVANQNQDQSPERGESRDGQR